MAEKWLHFSDGASLARGCCPSRPCPWILFASCRTICVVRTTLLIEQSCAHAGIDSDKTNNRLPAMEEITSLEELMRQSLGGDKRAYAELLRETARF